MPGIMCLLMSQTGAVSAGVPTTGTLGTGGKPVLDVIQGAGLVDCVVVVTRYFGGVLLGTGGLSRAYSQAASQAVKAAGRICMRPCAAMEIVCDYAQYGRILPLIASL